MPEGKAKQLNPAKLEMPKESVPGNGHTFGSDEKNYDVYKLIDLSENLVVRQIDVDTIKNEILQEKCWRDGDESDDSSAVGPGDLFEAIKACNGDYDRAIMEYPRLRKHIEKIRDADTGYPVLFRDNMIVADGMHRLTKAIIEGRKQIPAKLYEEMPDEAEIK